MQNKLLASNKLQYKRGGNFLVYSSGKYSSYPVVSLTAPARKVKATFYANFHKLLKYFTINIF